MYKHFLKNNIFVGIHNFKYSLGHKIPFNFFLNWLKEKWIADIKVVLWMIVFSPYIILASIGLLCLGIGWVLTNGLKSIIPDKLFLSPSLREKQIQAARKAREYKEKQGL